MDLELCGYLGLRRRLFDVVWQRCKPKRSRKVAGGWAAGGWVQGVCPVCVCVFKCLIVVNLLIRWLLQFITLAFTCIFVICWLDNQQPIKCALFSVKIFDNFQNLLTIQFVVEKALGWWRVWLWPSGYSSSCDYGRCHLTVIGRPRKILQLICICQHTDIHWGLHRNGVKGSRSEVAAGPRSPAAHHRPVECQPPGSLLPVRTKWSTFDLSGFCLTSHSM